MATRQCAQTAHEDLACRSCGPLRESGDSCQDPKCSNTIAGMESKCAQDSVNALDGHSNTRSSVLLAGVDALDALTIGLMVCNGFGQMLSANRTAEAILEARDGLNLNSDGVLGTTRANGRPLVELVRQAIKVASGKGRPRGAALAVRRPSGKRALTLLVRPVRNGRTMGDSTQPAALVLILDSALSVKTTAIELGELYGLTFAEARLANLLMDGKTLNNSACELGICRSTARAHLKHLFKKIRVRRQNELVSLLLRSIGLARLGQVVPEFAPLNWHSS
jgi:DNA-binding CsgD family transcriptional regulator